MFYLVNFIYVFRVKVYTRVYIGFERAHRLITASSGSNLLSAFARLKKNRTRLSAHLYVGIRFVYE